MSARREFGASRAAGARRGQRATLEVRRTSASTCDIAFSIPIPELVAFTVVAILAGLAAAIMPARRASRLNVLDALHYE